MRTTRPRPLMALALLVLIVAWALPAYSDVYIEQVTTVEPFQVMGQSQPGRTDTAQAWVADGNVYFRSTEMIAIVRPDKGMLYVLMPSRKEYVEVPLALIADPARMMKHMFGDTADVVMQAMREKMADLSFDSLYARFGDSAKARAVADLLEGMRGMLDPDSAAARPLITTTVEPTDEAGTVGKWKARKYLTRSTVMGMSMTQEVWASEEVGKAEDYENLILAMSGMFAGMPGYKKVVSEMQKIKGVPVRTITTMNAMGASMRSTAEVVRWEERPAPDGIFEVPADYRKVDRSRLSPH